MLGNWLNHRHQSRKNQDQSVISVPGLKGTCRNGQQLGTQRREGGRCSKKGKHGVIKRFGRTDNNGGWRHSSPFSDDEEGKFKFLERIGALPRTWVVPLLRGQPDRDADPAGDVPWVPPRFPVRVEHLLLMSDIFDIQLLFFAITSSAHHLPYLLPYLLIIFPGAISKCKL